MASLKVKFRPSTVEGKEGGIYFQIIHNRVVRQLNTDYKFFAHEWDAEEESIVAFGNRFNTLSSIKERLKWDIARLEKVIRQLEMERRRYTADDVITVFQRVTKEVSLFSFMHGVIAQLKQLGKIRTSETYAATLKSFMAFRNEQDVPLDGITSDLMLLYEAHLRARCVCMNTISFYMRILRAVYNRAVEKGLTPQRNPFRHVYTGVDKTVKRGYHLTLHLIRQHNQSETKTTRTSCRDIATSLAYCTIPIKSVESTTSKNSHSSIIWPLRIFLICQVIVAIPIAAPLLYISCHVIKTQFIG